MIIFSLPGHTFFRLVVKVVVQFSITYKDQGHTMLASVEIHEFRVKHIFSRIHHCVVFEVISVDPLRLNIDLKQQSLSLDYQC